MTRPEGRWRREQPSRQREARVEALRQCLALGGGADCQDGEEECAAGQTGKALRSQSSGTVSIWGLRPAPHLPHCIKMCFLRGFLLMKQEVRSLELAAS